MNTLFPAYMLLGILIAVVTIQIVKYCTDTRQVIPPVEENVDSVIKKSDSIKLIIETLNEDKNEKIIEVKNLSNDSTIELFLRLVKD